MSRKCTLKFGSRTLEDAVCPLHSFPMLLECHNCGAPLDVAGNATRVRCAYCKKTSSIDQFKRVADETPPDFKQPSTWTPKEGSALPSVPLDFRPLKMIAGIVARVYALAVLGVLLFGAVVVWRISSAFSSAAKDPVGTIDPSGQIEDAVTKAMNALASASETAVQAAGVGGNGGPIVCLDNQSMTVSGKVLSVPGGTPVIANGNCSLKLVACTLSGQTAVSAQGNSHVTIEGGTLTTTGPAVILGGNATAEISSTTITGEPAVRAADNARARVRGSQLTSKRVAVITKNNAHVDTVGSTVQGQVVGAR